MNRLPPQPLDAEERALAAQLRAAMPRLHLLLCTVGVLQDGAAKAEKGLSQISLEGLLATFQRNSFAPILLLKHLLPLLRGQHACTVAALSALARKLSVRPRMSNSSCERLPQSSHASMRMRRVCPASVRMIPRSSMTG